MKNIILIAIMAFSIFECSCQEKSTAWLPEQYVNAMLSKDSTVNKYLSPFEGIESHNETLYVLTYRGELNPAKVKAVIVNGKEKIQLMNLQYSVNLKYNPMELADRLSNAKIYLSKVNNKLCIEIIEGNKSEVIYFIDRIKNYGFISIREAKKQLME